jgi:hypothetical protein
MKRGGRRLWRVALAAATAAGIFAAGWAGWAAVAWVRYGHVQPRGPDDDPLLTHVMPRYEVVERQERLAAAPRDLTYAEVQRFALQQSPIIRAVFSARERMLRSKEHDRPLQPLLQEVVALGWRVVAEEPGRELVFGAVTQPWRSDVQFRGLAPEAFRAFDSAGYVKIAWTIAVDSIGPGRSRVRTETRAATTDPASRARFRRYWSIFSPGIVLIRYEALRVIAAQAEVRVPRVQ